MADAAGPILLATAWALGWLLFFRLPRLPAPSGVMPPPTRVAVVIPARNEERSLPVLLEALAAQTRPPDEVVVVDDSSSDATARVAAEGGARVVTAPPLPAGWTGKAWACWNGVHSTTGDVLLFLDADTRPEPALIARLLATLTDRRGLVSVLPHHHMRRPYERLSAFFNAISVMGIGAASARRGAPVTGAYGPCLVSTRAAYEAAGGHEAVRASVVDDVALAQRFRANRQPVSVVGGRGAIDYRLYPGGLRELADGWSKNFAAGAGSTPWLRFVLVAAWVIGAGSAAQAPFRAFAAGLAGWPQPGVLAWVAYAAFAVQLMIMLRPLGNYSWAAPLYPVPLAAWFVIFFRSIWWMARGRVRWKGRDVSMRATSE
ncbi:MAG: glycosyltransferase [Acidimicrobiia bacterium]